MTPEQVLDYLNELVAAKRSELVVRMLPHELTDLAYAIAREGVTDVRAIQIHLAWATHNGGDA